MTKTRSTSLTVTRLTATEADSYFEKFGETGWLDCEEKVLISVKDCNEFEISKLDMFFGIVSKDLTWIVVDLSGIVPSSER